MLACHAIEISPKHISLKIKEGRQNRPVIELRSSALNNFIKTFTLRFYVKAISIGYEGIMQIKHLILGVAYQKDSEV